MPRSEYTTRNATIFIWQQSPCVLHRDNGCCAFAQANVSPIGVVAFLQHIRSTEHPLSALLGSDLLFYSTRQTNEADQGNERVKVHTKRKGSTAAPLPQRLCAAAAYVSDPSFWVRDYMFRLGSVIDTNQMTELRPMEA